MLGALLGALGCSEGKRVGHVRIVTGDWPPFTDSSAPQHGRSARQLSAALGEMGLVPEYVFLPWSKATELAYAAETDDEIRGIFPMYPSAERKRRFRFSAPLEQVSWALFYDADKSKAAVDDEALDLSEAATVDQALNYCVLLVEAYAYPDAIERRFEQQTGCGTGPAGSPQRAESEFIAFRRLFDPTDPTRIVPAVPDAGRALLTRYMPNKLARLKQVPEEIPFKIHFLASKRNPGSARFIAQLDAALARVRDTGRVEQINTRQTQVTLDANPRAGKLEDGGLPGLEGRERQVQQGLPHAHRCDEPAGRPVPLPRGTRAAVLSWSGELGGTHDATHASLTRVVLLNGPREGQELCVHDEEVVLP